MRVLVTGASGFVGRALCERLYQAGLAVRATGRQALALPHGAELALIDDIGPETDWSDALIGVDAVVHLAARVHLMRDRAVDPLAAFRQVNVFGSETLARSAARAGVRRLVFISSVKSMGERTPPGRAFCEEDTPNPADPYAISKREAELSLRAISERTGMELVIVRPPLVYGPEVRANFLGLMKLAAMGVPLPLGRIDNRRSFVFVHNLSDALYRCIIDPRAANELFLIADDEALSTSMLFRELATALGTKARLLAVPPGALRLCAALAGQSAACARLTDSLVVDGSKIRARLDWAPPFSIHEGLAATARWFANRDRA